jgi:hypothetical protein
VGAPIFSDCPKNRTGGTRTGELADQREPKATDNGADAPLVRCTPSLAGNFPLGRTPVTCQVGLWPPRLVPAVWCPCRFQRPVCNCCVGIFAGGRCCRKRRYLRFRCRYPGRRTPGACLPGLSKWLATGLILCVGCHRRQCSQHAHRAGCWVCLVWGIALAAATPEGQNAAVVTFPLPRASDNVDQQLSPACSPPSGSPFLPGSSKVPNGRRQLGPSSAYVPSNHT